MQHYRHLFLHFLISSKVAIIGTVLLFFSVFPLCLDVSFYWDDVRFSEHGVEAEAVVTRKSPVCMIHTSTHTPENSCYAFFTYPNPTGAGRIEAAADITQQTWNEAQPGSPLRIVYLDSDTASVKVGELKYIKNAASVFRSMLMMNLGFVVFSILLVGLAYRKFKKPCKPESMSSPLADIPFLPETSGKKLSADMQRAIYCGVGFIVISIFYLMVPSWSPYKDFVLIVDMCAGFIAFAFAANNSKSAK